MRAIVFHPRIGKVLLGLAYNRCFGDFPLFPGGPVSLQTIQTEPLPGPSSVRVRCRLAGICGSDLNLLRLKFSTGSANMARKRTITRSLCMGHEALGEVLEVGPSVRTLTKGQRVVLVSATACADSNPAHLCVMCEQGFPLLCLNRDNIVPNLATGAAWSEQFVRHESQLIPVPDQVSDEQAVLVEPLACSVHAVLRRVPSPGDTVVVIGCGTIGLGIILVLRALSIPIRIIALFKHAYQASMALTMGADSALAYRPEDLYDQLAVELGTIVLAKGVNNRLLHQGASIVYDAVGSSDTLQHALRWVRARGAVVIQGITPKPRPSDCTPIWLREVDLVGSHGFGMEHCEGKSIHAFALVLDWIREKRLVPDQMITHRYPLWDYKSAFRTTNGKCNSKATKVIFEMGPDD